MLILSINPGHDGAVALVQDDCLVYSYEAEKDSFPRYAHVTPSNIVAAMRDCPAIPDVVAIGGWFKGASVAPLEAGYFGLGTKALTQQTAKLFGKNVTIFSSSHERSHLLGAYGMSPFAQNEPCYVLVWEGAIGAFYEIDRQLQITKRATVMDGPGDKYAALYSLANPAVKGAHPLSNLENAGKVMALAAYGRPGPLIPDEREVAEFILSLPSIVGVFPKEQLAGSPLYNAGVESQVCKDFARKFSDLIFDRFFDVARGTLTAGYPLLISGGCGLNCEWNAKWKESGLFSDVFVPPCANDTGSAIGTAVDAMHYYTGRAKLKWDVYAGQDFVDDAPTLSGLEVDALDLDVVAAFLEEGNVIAWVQGRCEIGPRSLGNRSILAAPFSEEQHRRLNTIKQREAFRPIAPICMEEEFAHFFSGPMPSPHMLFFHKVRTESLRAVTHVDGTARVQTVSAKDNPRIYALLGHFKQRTGYGVLCNTSLNFKGCGFINRMSDLVSYVRARKLDGFVVGDKMYRAARHHAVVEASSALHCDSPAER